MGEVLHYVLLGNATLIAAFFCAWLLEKMAVLINLRTAYRLRLHLAVAALCAASLPLILAPFMPFFAKLFAINGTDFVVSQYLKGNISLSATQLSDILSAKNTATDLMLGGDSTISKIVQMLFGLTVLGRTVYIGLNIAKIRKHINCSLSCYHTSRVDIRISRNTTIPFSTRGFFKYYILIPEKLVADPRTFRIALGHEAQHIRQGDVDWEFLLCALSPIFALNPAFWLISDRIRRFREYTCDAAFLKKGGITMREYCLLLLDIASQAARNRVKKNTSTYPASVSFFGRDTIFNHTGKNALRKRIIALSQGACFVDDGLGKFVNVVPAFFLLLLVGTGVLITVKPVDWSHDRLMFSTVVNLERLDRINRFGVSPFR